MYFGILGCVWRRRYYEETLMQLMVMETLMLNAENDF